MVTNIIRTAENLLEFDIKVINEIILQQFNKSENDINEYVNLIKEWIKTQLHLPDIPGDFLIKQFLIFNKFHIEEVKRKLDMYYTVRTLIPDFFEDKHPLSQKMVRQSELVTIVPLPKSDRNYNRVLYLKINESYTPEEVNFDLIAAHVFNRIELFLDSYLATEIVFIVDLKFFKTAHFVKLDVMFLKKVIFIVRNVYSSKVRAFHLINGQQYINVLVNMIKSLLPKKLADRVHSHKNLETLFETVPIEICPEDIGGYEVPLEVLNDLWQNKFNDYKDRFDMLETLKINEDLRPAPLINSDILGYHGNFKKLDVD